MNIIEEIEQIIKQIVDDCNADDQDIPEEELKVLIDNWNKDFNVENGFGQRETSIK